MFTLEANILIGALIATAMLTYVLVLQKIKQKANIPVKTASVSTEDAHEDMTHGDESARHSDDEDSQEKAAPKHVPCGFHFGYLRKIPKNSSFPNECLGCPRVVDCMTFSESEEG